MKLKELIESRKDKISLKLQSDKAKMPAIRIYRLYDAAYKDIPIEEFADEQLVAIYRDDEMKFTEAKYDDMSYALDLEAEIASIDEKRAPWTQHLQKECCTVFVENLLPKYNLAICNDDEVALYSMANVLETDLQGVLSEGIEQALKTAKNLTVLIRAANSN